MGAKDSHRGEANRQLRGWKEIAASLGKDESTVKRWAATRGLPVHRAPGTKRSSVYGWTHEMSDWLMREPRAPSTDDVSPIPPAPSPTNAGTRRLATAILTVVIILGMVAGAYAFLQSTNSFSPWRAKYRPSDVVQNLFNEGIYLYRKRTPENLERAAKNFKRAIDIDPGFADAHAALAITYDLMVEYGSIEAHDGYKQAKERAEAALSLGAESADALAVLGDVTFFQDKQYEQALTYFERAIRADPANALAHQWYAAALQSVGRFQEALHRIGEAQRLDPTARSILVSKAMVLIARGDVTAGETVLQQLITLEPGYRSPYRFLSFAALERGDATAYLAALNERFSLTKDSTGLQIVEAGADGYSQGGHRAMSMAMLLKARELSATTEPYFLAHVFALAGELDEASTQLATIKTRHAFYYVLDPAFKVARQDPQFQRAMRAIGLPVIQ